MGALALNYTGLRFPEAQGIVKEHFSQPSARYGVEIRFRSHAEADDVEQILAAVDGHPGTVCVIDRHSQAVVFEGSPGELREAVSTSATFRGIESRHVGQ